MFFWTLMDLNSYSLEMVLGYYYLCDAGYTNCEGFLAPYRQGHQPTTPKEFFNMKHSFTRNFSEI